LKLFTDQQTAAAARGGDGAGGDSGGGAAAGPAGSIKALQEQVAQLKQELDVQTTESGIQRVIEQLIEKQSELEDLQRTVETIRNVAEEAVVDFDGANVGADVQIEDVGGESDQEYIQRQQEIIDARAQAAIQALQSEELSFQEYENRKTEILREAEMERLELQLAFAQEGTAEYLAIKNKMYELETQRAREAKQNQEEVEEQFYEEIKQLGFQFLQDTLNNQFQGQLNAIEERKNKQIEALEEEQRRRLELAEEGSLEEERLLREFEQQRQEIELEAARKSKEIQVKQAIANTALAIGNALATVKPFAPNAIAAAAIAAVQGAIQVATIQSQTFAKGGRIKGPAHSQGGVPAVVRSTGQRVELEGEEGVINKRSMRSSKVVTVTGRPAEIASAINAMDNNGVPFSGIPKARLRYKFQTGGVIPSATQLNLASGGQNAQGSSFVVSLEPEALEGLRMAVYDGSRGGAKDGSREGISDSAKSKARQDLLNKRTNL
jgi:hypothetical protein